MVSKNTFLRKKEKRGTLNPKIKVTTKRKYAKLDNYSQLLNYMDPIYKWEIENYPFLSQFPAFRFVRKEKASKLEDYQSIYINSKENLIYTFNLVNQSYSLSLEAFMIDDIREFYISLELEETKDELKLNFNRLMKKNKIKKGLIYKKDENYHMYIKDIKLVFSFFNEETKPLEAYLYPSRSDKIPYLISKNDTNYNLIIDNAFSIISFLELLQGGFFLEQDKNISSDGIIRIKV